MVNLLLRFDSAIISISIPNSQKIQIIITFELTHWKVKDIICDKFSSV